METVKALTALSVGEVGVITGLCVGTELHRRLIDIGFSKGSPIRKIGKAPLGDPSIYEIKGTVVALRQEIASAVYVNQSDLRQQNGRTAKTEK